MAGLTKCGSCGFESDNFPGAVCPQCGKNLLTSKIGRVKWPFALLQLALVAGFMLAFHFPRPMILFFVAMIVLGTVLSNRLQAKLPTPHPRTPSAPQTPAVRLLNAAIALCGFAFLLAALFGFVIFMNSWTSWERFRGQSYHETTFQVMRTYYQPARGKRGAQAYASGMVEGRKEWMDLFAYLKPMPRSQDELEQRIPIGDTIPVYLFPDLKGYSRVQVIGDLPPAEANYKRAIWVLNHGLAALGILAGIVFVLVRVRRTWQQPGNLAAAAGM